MASSSSAYQYSCKRAREPFPHGNSEQQGGLSAEACDCHLASVEMPKRGPAYDLPLALATLVGSAKLVPPRADTVFVGETLARRRTAAHKRRPADFCLGNGAG